MRLLILLLLFSCATVQKKEKTLGLCQDNGVLIDEENPERVNCSEIKLFSSDNRVLDWNEGTYKATLVKSKEAKIYFLYSSDGRYYVLVSGKGLLLEKAEGTLSLDTKGEFPEYISLAAEEKYLSGFGMRRSGKTSFNLSIKIPKLNGKFYKAKLEFELKI